MLVQTKAPGRTLACAILTIGLLVACGKDGGEENAGGDTSETAGETAGETTAMEGGDTDAETETGEVPCFPGAEGCDCLQLSDSCQPGLTCIDGTCECPIGWDGCDCGVDGECQNSASQCNNGTCECPIGSDGCDCLGGNQCDGALSCNEDGLCECAVGTNGCPCTQGGSCGSGLMCVEVEGQLTCSGCTEDNPYCPLFCETGNLLLKEFPSDEGYPYAICPVECGPGGDSSGCPLINDQFAICLSPPSGDICANHCNADADCPFGWCMNWGDVQFCAWDNPSQDYVNGPVYALPPADSGFCAGLSGCYLVNQ